MGPKLAAALVAAQAEMRAIAKDSKNPHFNSKFASLDAIIEETRPILARHGLGVVQGAQGEPDGKGLTVATTLFHESGEEFSTGVYIPFAKVDPQGAGSAIKYGRRYGISAALCLSTEDDDDGNAASRPAPAKRATRTLEPGPPMAHGTITNVSKEKKRYEVSKWLGRAEDRPMPIGKHKGTPLGDLDMGVLREFEKWAVDQLGLDDLLKDVKTVLADMALSGGTLSNRVVGKMHADIAKDEAPLTALLDRK